MKEIISGTTFNSEQTMLRGEMFNVLGVVGREKHFRYRIIGASPSWKSELVGRLNIGHNKPVVLEAIELERMLTVEGEIRNSLNSIGIEDGFVIINSIDKMSDYQNIYKILSEIDHDNVICFTDSSSYSLPYREGTFTHTSRVSIMAKAYQFEFFVAKMLKLYFKNIVSFPTARENYDLKIDDNSVEIKYILDGKIRMQNIDAVIKQFSRKETTRALLVTNGYFGGESELDRINERISPYNIEIISLNHLLYFAEETDIELIKELNEYLSFSTTNIVRYNPSAIFEKLGLKPIKKLLNPPYKIAESKIKSGKKDFKKYEEYCRSIIEFLFGDSVQMTNKRNVNANLAEADAIAKLKCEDTLTGFWKLIYDRFRTNYVVFEMKNYSKPISQNNIYVTEKYLYDTALRNVAIVFTRKGADAGAFKALEGCLREHGKLFIVLDDGDINNLIDIKMKNLKQAELNETPSTYLLQKVDDLLVNLGK
ncbi:MAG: hypothetical protein FWC00_01140 [Firmicutes bacterium]|nr:hypothetical protein [Bacillota bacterium]